MLHLQRVAVPEAFFLALSLAPHFGLSLCHCFLKWFFRSFMGGLRDFSRWPPGLYAIRPFVQDRVAEWTLRPLKGPKHLKCC